MKYIEALGEVPKLSPKPGDAFGLDDEGENRPFVFMCGGITNCPDWQQDFVKLMEPQSRGTLFNPRRADFPIGDPNAAKEQITWEFNALNGAHMYIFWFSDATIQPIVLFELGARLAERRKDRYSGRVASTILIGIEEGYTREQDVRIQTELVDPAIPIVRTLEELAGLLHEEVARF